MMFQQIVDLVEVTQCQAFYNAELFTAVKSRTTEPLTLRQCKLS